MTTWRRSRDGDKCPLDGQPLKADGSKWATYPRPCIKFVDHQPVRCPHLSREFTGCYQTSVQCSCSDQREG